jgi:cytochrome c oxidase subunit 3/cytochrome o ubiquinol oxidase subunit 3
MSTYNLAVGAEGSSLAREQAGLSAASKGKAGMACLIVAESAIFAIFVVAYLYYLGRDVHGPTPKEVLRLPILNTVCLLSSSITITLAVRALTAGFTGQFAGWWLATIGLGGYFLLGTGVEWYHLIYEKGLSIKTNLFGSTFYSLVGLHASHVVIGLVALLTVMCLTLARTVKRAHADRVEVLAIYWHFVDAVWVVVFTVVYIIGR